MQVVIVRNDFPVVLERVQQRTRALLWALGLAVEAHAKAIVPVRTGALRASIATWWESPDRVAVGSPLHYAVFVELGTRRMAARPYLRPALERVRQEAPARTGVVVQ